MRLVPFGRHAGLVAVIVLIAACSETTPPDPVVTIAVSPSSATVAVGATSQLSATARNGAGAAVAGAPITWASSNSSVATVTGAGLVTGTGAGTASIVATSGSASGSAAITVPAVPTSISVTPTSTLVGSLNTSFTLTAVAKAANGSTVSGVTFSWSSSAPGVATVNGSGVVTSVANGTATITAASGTLSGTATVTITQTASAIAVAPATASIAAGATQQLTAAVTDLAGNAMSAAVVTWSTSAASVATVSSAGLVTGIGAGTATITATSGSASGTAAITVTAPVVDAITVTPTSATLTSFGSTQQITAVTKDASGATITAPVTWSTSAAGVATVSTSGLVTAVANGTATITATAGGKSATSAITVAQPEVVDAITVTPTTATLTSFGATQQITAVTKNASGATITAPVTWSTSAAAVATVSTSGLVTAVANGTATITATSGSKSAATAITVAQAINTVAVTPSSATIASFGATQALTAVARDANDNTVAGTTFSWTTSQASVATVNATSGLVTAVSNGTATITATASGKSGTSAITVAQGLNSISVAGTASLKPQAATSQLTATGKDANNNTMTLGTVTWTSSATAVATVSATGLVTPLTPGTTTITATSGGKSGTLQVTVDKVPLAWAYVIGSTAGITPTNLAGGGITIAKLGTGQYVLSFDNLGSNTGRVGQSWSIMVTSHSTLTGTHSQLCHPASMNTGDLNVTVYCKNVVSKALQDANFMIVAVGNGALPAPSAFSAHNAAQTTTYVADPTRAYNSSGGSMLVNFDNAAYVTHQFSTVFQANFGQFTSAFDTSTGFGYACTVATFPVAGSQAGVACRTSFSPANHNPGAQHSFLAVSSGRTSTLYGQVRFTNTGALVTSQNATGFGATPAHISTGTYEVSWQELKMPDSKFAVLVSTIGSTVWESCGYELLSTSDVVIRIHCVGLDGAPKNVSGQINVMILR